MIHRSEHQPDPRDPGRDLSQQLKRLAKQRKVDEGKTGDVAAGVRQADDNALINGIVDYRKDDGDRARRLLHGFGAWRAVGDYDIRRKPYQLGCVLRETARIAPGPTHVNPEITAFRPSQFPQSRPQRRDAFLPKRIAFSVAHQHAEAPRPRPLLGSRTKRPNGRRAANKRDELAPSHSIILFGDGERKTAHRPISFNDLVRGSEQHGRSRRGLALRRS